MSFCSSSYLAEGEDHSTLNAKISGYTQLHLDIQCSLAGIGHTEKLSDHRQNIKVQASKSELGAR